MATKTEGTTRYSENVKGEHGNYGWVVSFDAKDGYIGITQWVQGHTERILLSPKQFAALKKFAAGSDGSRNT